MKSLLSKLSIVLVMTGFIAACGGDPNIESAKLNLNRSDYEKVLESADAAIENNADNPLGYYYRGVALSEMGKAKPYNQRVPQFEEANEAFMKSLELFQAQGRMNTNEAQFVDVRLTQIWAEEYNNAVQRIVPEDREPTRDELVRSTYHLKNSYAILPDSTQSLDVLAEVYYMLQEVPQAIDWLTKAINESAEKDSYRWLRLNYFYSQIGEQGKALQILQDALNEFPGDIELTQEVANVYLAMGRTDEALEVIRGLIEIDPDNAQYRLVFGSQVYQFVLDMGDDLRDASDNLSEKTRLLRTEERKARPDQALVAELRADIIGIESDIRELLSEIERLTQEAEDELQLAAQLEDDNPIIFNTLGIIYQNRAANLFDLRNATDDIRAADAYDAQAREMLRTSLKYYEKAAGLDPDNADYWLSLFRIYTTLGMTEQAMEAQRKAGLD